MADRQPCGTYAAYVRHIRSGEDACPPCKAALAVYQATKLANETRRCSHEDCDTPIRARGMCRAHYERWLRSTRTSTTGQAGRTPKRKSAVREEYEFFRAQGFNREVSAARAGANLKSTYAWEPAAQQRVEVAA